MSDLRWPPQSTIRYDRPGAGEHERFDQQQDPAAAFFVEAVHRKAVPKQVTKELKLGN